jgi:hypothetical protein
MEPVNSGGVVSFIEESGLFRVQFIEESGLFRVLFRQVLL